MRGSKPIVSNVNNRIRGIAAVAILCALWSVPRVSAEPEAPAELDAISIRKQKSRPTPIVIQRQIERHKYIRLDKFRDALGVHDGMTILDIGAGGGLTSFWFAETLHGTGQVFATDVIPDYIEYIEEEAKSRGLTNISPVVVRRSGTDEFYGKHRYDFVLVSNVYFDLEKPVDYFKALRPFLNPGARLVFVIYNQAPLYSPDDLTDLDGLALAVKASPLLQKLSSATLSLLDDPAAQGGESLRNAMTEDFNRILTEPRLFESFMDYNMFRHELLGPAERQLADWLVMTLRESGNLDKPAAQIEPAAMRSVIRLNRLLFSKKFGNFLANDGMGALYPAGDANHYTSKYALMREMGLAGYRFVKEIRLSPFFDAVIFH